MILEIVALVFLVILAAFDWKFKQVPAFMTTSFLFVMAILTLFITGYGGLNSGLLAFLFALLMVDTEFFTGMADLKVMSALGMYFKTGELLGFFVYFLLIGVAYKVTYRIAISKKLVKKTKEVPFIPVILLSYVVWLIPKFF